MKTLFLKGPRAGLVLCVLAALMGADPASAETFVLTSTFDVGAGPFNVVAADVNGDGKLDLISADDGVNFDNNTLTVLTNNGTGAFGLNATYTVGYNPAVTAADLNNNGRPDLIAANFNDNSVIVLTNDGTGGFGSNATYAVDSGPINVAAADVNKDGKLDLISANRGTNTLTVLTNNGNSKFTWSATLAVDYGPYVIAGDVNGDSNVDLISANNSANTLTVLTNNGSGGFGSNATYVVGIGPNNVVAADVNGDNKLDLITANDGPNNDGTGNTLTILTNNGNGRFTFCATLLVGKNPYVTAGDVNGDGKVDVISANYFTNSLLVLTNNGTGVFGSNATYAVGIGPICALAADLNNDGRQELISANLNSVDLTVRLETPKLNQQFTNHAATISWPPLWGGYVLQTNANPGIVNWGNAINPTGTNRLIFPATNGTKLFRLRHP